MKITSLLKETLSVLLLLVVLAGCASVSVRDQHQMAVRGERTKPDKIYVRDFDFSSAELNVDRSGDDLKQFKEKSVEAISSILVAELQKFYPAERIALGAPTPAGNSVLLEGRVTKINQGSRALRMVVGFGAGGTKMETSITLYDSSVVPAKSILSFDTTGGSGAEPGVTGTDPITAAGSAAAGAGKGVTDDTKRTARMIAYRISEYMGDQNWISPEQVKQSKKNSD
jgi:hypothetical protein